MYGLQAFSALADYCASGWRQTYESALVLPARVAATISICRLFSIVAPCSLSLRGFELESLFVAFRRSEIFSKSLMRAYRNLGRSR